MEDRGRDGTESRGNQTSPGKLCGFDEEILRITEQLKSIGFRNNFGHINKSEVWRRVNDLLEQQGRKTVSRKAITEWFNRHGFERGLARVS